VRRSGAKQLVVVLWLKLSTLNTTIHH